MSFSRICMEKSENLIILLQKYSPCPANKFLVHTVGATGKLKNSKKNNFEKFTSPADEFLFINVETIGKYKIVKQKSHLKRMYKSN